MSKKQAIPYSELPELCYAEVNGHLVTVKKGVSRFERSPLDTGDLKGCREIATLKNELLGVTPAQRAAMCRGVIFGWNTAPASQRDVKRNDKMFTIYIGRPTESGVSLSLPATHFELRDALEQARVTNERDIYNIEVENCALDYLPQLIAPSANLYELNHLAQRLAALSDWDRDCFEGLTMMDAIKNKYAPIPVDRLINMTHSTEDCQIAHEACDDASLGKFYVDNDFPVIPTGIPKILYEMLDYESIGRKAREGEGGVFTPNGYVVHSGKMAEVYHSGDAVPKEKPRYTIMLEVCKGYFNDPDYNSGSSEYPMLPADDGIIDRAVAQVEAASVEECSIQATDCIVPKLTEIITNMLEYDVSSYRTVNELAEQLSRLEKKGLLTTYKAILASAPQDITLEEALDISYDTEGFILAPQQTDPADYAKDELGKCGVPMLDELCSMANLHQYGERLMAENHVMDTPYGMLHLMDGQTVEQCLNRKQPVSGMEMR